MQRNQTSNCQHPLDHRKSKRVPEKKKKNIYIYFCFIDYAKAFVWITTNWKIFKEMEIPDHLSCLLRNLYAGQEATVRTRHRTMDWFKTGKGVHQGCILSPAYSTSIQSISYKMPGWMKLESRLLGEISTISDMQIILP